MNTIILNRRSLVALMAAVFLELACSSSEQTKNQEEVIVRVGDAALTLEEIASEVPAAIRDGISKEQIQDYIVQWTHSQVLYQEAKRQGLDQGIDLHRELQRLERELVVDALLKKEVYGREWNVSPGEIQEFYNTNNENFRRQENEIRAWHIQTPGRMSADSLLRRVKTGYDFSTVAKAFAAAQGAPDSWDVILAESDLPEAAQQIFKLRTGTISGSIELADGFHLFYIVEKFNRDSIRELELVRNEITSKIQARKQEERHRELLSELITNARIEKNFQRLESIPLDSIFVRASHNAK